MTAGSITALVCAIIAVTFATLAMRDARRARAAAVSAAEARAHAALRRLPSTVHIDGELVDFSPTVLGQAGEPVCTCTVSVKCLRCYEESL